MVVPEGETGKICLLNLISHQAHLKSGGKEEVKLLSADTLQSARPLHLYMRHSERLMI